jgi:hypothetical protein
MGDIGTAPGALVEPTNFVILSLSKDAGRLSKRFVTPYEAIVIRAWNTILAEIIPS